MQNLLSKTISNTYLDTKFVIKSDFKHTPKPKLALFIETPLLILNGET